MQSWKLSNATKEGSPILKPQSLRFHYLGFSTIALKTSLVIATLLTVCDGISIFPSVVDNLAFVFRLLDLWMKALALWYVSFLLMLLFVSLYIGEIIVTDKGIRLGNFSKYIPFSSIKAISVEPQKRFAKLFAFRQTPLKLILFIARPKQNARWKVKELPSFFFEANDFQRFLETIAFQITNLEIKSDYYLSGKSNDLPSLKRNYCFYNKQRLFFSLIIALSLICFLGRRTYVYYLYNLGNAESRQGAYQKAADDYRKALQADPYFAYGFHNLAIAEYNLKDSTHAIQHWKKALFLKPDFVEPKVSLAYYCLQNYDYNRAKQLLDKATNIAPNDPYVLINSAQVSLRSGHTQQAMRTARLLLAQNNKNTTAIAMIAQARIRIGRPNDALKLLDKARKNNYLVENDIYCKLVRAEALTALAKLDQAESLLIKLSQSQPNNSDIYFDLAQIFLKEGKTTEAEKILTKAKVLEPNNPRTFLLEASIDLANNDKLGAEKNLFKSLKITELGFSLVEAHEIACKLGNKKLAGNLAKRIFYADTKTAKANPLIVNSLDHNW